MIDLQSFATGFDILTLTDPNGSKSSFSGSVLVRSFWVGIVNAERLFNAAFELHKSVLRYSFISKDNKIESQKLHSIGISIGLSFKDT